MSEWIKVIILGIVEGLTEFLPVSSTGHLIVAAALLDFQGSLNGTFEIFIQLGAVVAVITYFRADLLQQAKAFPVDPPTRWFWMMIIVAAVPAGLIGFLFSDWIKSVLFTPAVVAVSLIVGGVLFLILERLPRRSAETNNVKAITLRQAVIIGIAQIVALIPGVSRSGASILGGMFAGLNRQTATQFSFYLAIPVLGGATVYELLKVLGQLSGSQMLEMLLGAVVSGIVAWMAISWLLRYVASHTFVAFGYYRIAAGIIILLLLQTSIL